MSGIIIKPDTETRLQILAESAQFDVCLSSCNSNPRGGAGRVRNAKSPSAAWIYPARVPGKGTVSILKVLQTNLCENMCSYCMLAASRDSVARVSFSPSELASLFMGFVEKRLASGIFISSGSGLNTDSSMESMIDTAWILRKRYRFTGYIHLKVLPGCSFGLIDEACRLADRISVNMEAPSRAHLKIIAHNKDLANDIVARMRHAGRVIEKGSRARSQTTQLIVGASCETDSEILSSIDWVYRELFVFRAYFSAFQNPAERGLRNYDSKSDAQNLLVREHRLYQCDFLMRGYGFRLKDFVFDGKGNLPIDCDPKNAYALMHPELFPVDVNKACELDLLKVPGIGPVSARRIITLRSRGELKNLSGLKSAGALISHAAPYVIFSGKRDRVSEGNYIQNELFDLDDECISEWKTGLIPLQHEKLVDPASGSLVSSYEYPGQKGKPFMYDEENILCR